MIRGTTPTLTFTLPFQATAITKLNIAFAQYGRVVLEKELYDCSVSGNVITVQLTESETLEFGSSNGSMEIQLRVGIGETRLASNIVKTTVERILKGGAL